MSIDGVCTSLGYRRQAIFLREVAWWKFIKNSSGLW